MLFATIGTVESELSELASFVSGGDFSRWGHSCGEYSLLLRATFQSGSGLCVRMNLHEWSGCYR